MRYGYALAATAAAVSFGAIDANAVAVTVNLTFIPTAPGASAGTGFFVIDDSRLQPADLFSPVRQSGLGDLQDFGATFVDVPGAGDVTFVLADLTNAVIKVDQAGAFAALEFETADTGSGFHLTRGNNEVLPDDVGPFSGKELHDMTIDLVNSETDQIVLSYDVSATASAIPAPGTLGLLAAGAAGLGLIRRRRSAARAAATH